MTEKERDQQQASRTTGQDTKTNPGHQDERFNEDEEGSRRDVNDGTGEELDQEVQRQAEPNKSHGDVEGGSLEHR